MSLMQSLRDVFRKSGRTMRTGVSRRPCRPLSFETLEPRHLLSITVWLDFEPDPEDEGDPEPQVLMDTLNLFAEDAQNAGRGFGAMFSEPTLLDYEIQPISEQEAQWIKADIISQLHEIFSSVPSTDGFMFTETKPMGIFETITFYEPAPPSDPGALGSATFDWLLEINNSTQDTARVHLMNFPFLLILGADYFARDETRAAETLDTSRRAHHVASMITTLAAHELGHTFGLDHYNCFGDVNINPADTDGLQNAYIMAIPPVGNFTIDTTDSNTLFASLSAVLEGAIFSPMSLDILRYGKNGLGEQTIPTMTMTYGVPQELTFENGCTLVRPTTDRDGLADQFTFSAAAGQCVTVMVNHLWTIEHITIRDAQGQLLAPECYRAQVVEPDYTSEDMFGWKNKFAVEEEGGYDLSRRRDVPMLLNVTLPHQGTYSILVTDEGGNNGQTTYDMFVSLGTPDATGASDIEITDCRSDGTNLLVDYQISGEAVGQFDITFLGVLPGQADVVLQRTHVYGRFQRTVGSHSIMVPPNFTEDKSGYKVMVYADHLGQVVESNDSNNSCYFENGVFIDRSHEVIHVHGSDAAADTVTFNVNGASVEVMLNGQSFGPYDQTEVEFHARTHGGVDSITHSGDPITTVVWVFSGPENDYIEANSGFLELSGGPGSDTYRFTNGGSASWLCNCIIYEEYVVGDEDTLSFVSFTPGGGDGIEIDLSDTDAQNVAAYLGLTLSDDDGIERVFGTAYDDLIRGNALDNILAGTAGDDDTYRFANASGRHDLAARPIALALAA